MMTFSLDDGNLKEPIPESTGLADASQKCLLKQIGINDFQNTADSCAGADNAVFLPVENIAPEPVD